MRSIYQRISNFPEDFIKEVGTAYNRCLCVENISRWFKKFDLLSKVVENRKGTYRQLENHIFELKVINYFHNISSDSQIIYEPPVDISQGKNCDLLVKGRQSYLIELKSFHPDDKIAHIPYKYITENNELIMDGHCYHAYQAARGHLIDATYHTEEKMKNYEDKYINVMGVLLGFYLHLEDFRDFVAIYRNGKYRFDDPLGRMTLHIMEKEFTGNIKEFWGFPFQQVSFSFEQGKTVTSVSPVQFGDKEVKI